MLPPKNKEEGGAKPANAGGNKESWREGGRLSIDPFRWRRNAQRSEKVKDDGSAHDANRNQGAEHLSVTGRALFLGQKEDGWKNN